MRCYSCANYTVARCLLDHPAWPDARLDDCPDASYEPGTSPVEFGSEAEYRLEAAQRR